MNLYRSGLTSVFPGSLDQFVIKTAFSSGGTQLPTAMIKDSHWNHYFDACFNIERYLYGRLGGPIYGVTSTSSSLMGTDVIFSTETYSVTISGSSAVISATVPAIFGSSPFADNGFAIKHSTYFVAAASGGAMVQGVWANNNYSAPEPFNKAIIQPQFFTSFAPTTGRNYQITVYRKDYRPYSYYQSLTDLFYTAGDGDHWNYDFNFNANDNGQWDIVSYQTGHTIATNRTAAPILQINYTGNTTSAEFLYTNITPWIDKSYTYGGNWGLMQLQSGVSNTGGGGYLVANLDPSPDGEVIFQSIYTYHSYTGKLCLCHTQTTPTTTAQYVGRFGPCVRFQGSLTNASFYGIAFGDYYGAGNPNTDDTAHNWIRIIKAVNVPLWHSKLDDNSLSNDHTSTSWSSSTLGGTLTELATYDMTSYVAAGASYFKLSVQGNTISVSISHDGSAWTSIYSAVDGSSPITGAGQHGFFVRGQNSNTGMSRGMLIGPNVQIRNIVASVDNYPVQVKVLYAKVTPDPLVSVSI